MNSFLIYIIHANIVLAILYMIYWLVSRKNTFFELHRFMLIFIWIAFPLVPLIHIPGNTIHQENVLNTEKGTNVLNNFQIPSAEFIRENLDKINATGVDYTGYACVASITISLLMIIRMLMQLSSVVSIYRKSHGMKYEDGTPIRLLPGNDASFSFFKWIFIYAGSIQQGLTPDIVRHEKVHAYQWHSFDICLSQFFTAICWFNPFAYLLMIETRRNLEFIADRNTIRNGSDRKAYQYNLLRLTYHVYPIQIYNSFNYSYIKERILMINKKPSRNCMRWNYLALLAVAIAFPILGVFSGVKGTLEAASAIQLAEANALTTVITTPSIVGAWMIDSGDSIISYKLLTKDGRYINMRSFNRGKTYTVTRKGIYEVVGDNVYIENLEYEGGEIINPAKPILFRYNKNKSELHLKFVMWGKSFHEVWKRAKMPQV